MVRIVRRVSGEEDGEEGGELVSEPAAYAEVRHQYRLVRLACV